MSSTAVLVADLVESTSLSTRIGESAFELVLQTHDDVAADVVSAYHGRVVRYLGDGFIAAFSAAGDALGCAEAFQQLTPRLSEVAGETVRARVGVSLGDLVEADGDLHGRAMAEAARLCAAAENGTILCTDLACRAAGARPETDFGPVLQLDLKGLPTLAARELRWDHTQSVEWTGLSLDVIGPMRVTRNGRPIELGGPKERQVLALLAANADRVVGLDTIVEGVWGDHPPRTAARSVHAYVARLRRAVEPARRAGAPPRVVITEGRGYRLAVPGDALDATRFARLVRHGGQLLADGKPSEAEESLRAALALWRGIPYEAHLDIEECAAESRRLEERRGLALEDHVAARLDLGAAGDLVPEIEELVREYPLRERAWEFLMLALYRAGRQGDALRAYQRARLTLGEALGVEPGPALRHLEAAILDHDPALHVSMDRIAGPHGALPAPLDPGTTTMVGRNAEFAVLRRAWESASEGAGGFVAVAGPEGIGKTRLTAELAASVQPTGAIVLYAASDPTDSGPRALLSRALRSGGVDESALGDDFDRVPGEAIARRFPAWSEGAPVLLVLEHLHHADATTIEAIADIAEWSANLRLLVVGTFRSDDDVAVPGGGASHVVLRPLGREALGEIAMLYGDAWTADEIGALASASGGLPLTAHRLAGEWAREAGLRRVDAAAARAAAARMRLSATRDDLANGVAELQRLLERRRDQLPTTISDERNRGRPPYRGLEMFESTDADVYFGREHLVAELVARVATSPFVAIIGPSGSGKSSLARAGLVPAIASGVLPGSEAWTVEVVAPGVHPLAAITAAERRAELIAPRLLLVDPLEELWSVCRDARERTAFIDRLLALAAEPGTVVVACIRSDFVGRVAEHSELAAAVGAGTLLVSAMTDTELHRVVVGPAQRRGLEIEPALVDAAVADVAGRVGALPLLSTALLATWERRSGSVLTVQAYRDAGGVASALADLADACYESLEETAHQAARQVLLRLASDDGGTDVRMRARVADLSSTPAARTALDALVRRRLVTIDGDEAEITHEALLREWPRLVAWLDEDRAGRRLQRRIADAARAWREADEDPSELYRGTRLQGALDWAETQTGELTRDEHAFLLASKAAAESEMTEAQERAEREARRNRRLRLAVGGLVIVLVVALISGALAVSERARADRTATDAERQALLSDVSRLAIQSRAESDTDFDRALLLAVEAYRLHPSVDTEGALAAALATAPKGIDSSIVFDPPAQFANITDDGTLIAAPGSGGIVRLIDARSGREVRQLDGGPPTTLLATQFSGDGRVVAAGGSDGRVTIWEIESGRRMSAPLPSGGNGPAYGVFDPTDATRFYTASYDGRVVRWDLTTEPEPEGVELFRIPRTTSSTFPMAIFVSNDGTRLLVGDPTAATAGISSSLWDIEADQQVALLPGAPGMFTADGRTLATTTSNEIHHWDATTGATLSTAITESGLSSVASLSPDGTRLAVGRADDRTYVLDVKTGRDVIEPIKLDSTLTLARFLPDGRLFVRSTDRAAILRLEGASVAATGRVLGDQDSFVRAWFSADGTRVVNVDDEGTARIWDAERPSEATLVADPSGATDTRVLVSPNLRTVAVRDGLNNLQLLDRSSGELLGVIAQDAAEGYTVTWSPDGARLALSLEDSVELWKVSNTVAPQKIATLQAIGAPDRPPQSVTQVAFSPDGRSVAVVRQAAGVASVFDTGDGRLRSFAVLGRPAMVTAAFSPDGRTLAAATYDPEDGDGGVAFFDVKTGKQRSPALALTDPPLGIAYLRGGDRFVTLRAEEPIVDGVGGSSALDLWDARTLRAVGEPFPFAGVLSTWSLDVSADGRRVVVGTLNGYAVMWDVDPELWRAVACRVAGRALTQREWNQYLSGRPYDPACQA